MQDEEIDIRIREAADQHHPPYDDKAWEKMELLLDKHLPVKKDRKRWLIFLLLFLLLDGAIFLAIVNPWKTKKPVVAEVINNNPASARNENKNDNTPLPGNANVPDDNNIATIPSKTNSVKDNINNTPGSVNEAQPINSNTTNNSTAVNNGSRLKNIPVTKRDLNNGSETVVAADRKNILKNKSRLSSKIRTPGTATDNVVNEQPPGQNTTTDKDENTGSLLSNSTKATELINKTTVPVNLSDNNDPAAIAKADSAKTKKNTTPEKTKDQQLAKTDKDKKKPAKGFGNNFGITLSGAADMSYVNIKRPGKTTFLYGAGLSYTIAKRLTVRSGFYVTKKIYSATPDEYNGTIYPNLDKIDGDCKVYEIPFGLSYNFGQRKKHSWSGSAAISSYLMKNEHYNYEYKNSTGQYYYYNRSVDNQNKHYFSVFTISGGYQYNLNNRFSLMAEPYVKLPLKGIGYGKMKLNSAGLMVTFTVKPFAKRK